MATDIIFAYGLSNEETAAAVRETVAAHDGNVGLAALDYVDANPNASLEEIEAAIRSCVGDTDLVHCQCGQITGERCAWHGPRSETVVVEYMPESLRASHEAAGNRGSYPANGAIRCRCERECAARIVEEEDGWASIVD